MELEFSGDVLEWRGPSPYYFVAVPEQASRDLRAGSGGSSWGMLPVRVRIGGTEWATSMWPKDGSYLVPLKDVVRKSEQLDVGTTVTVRLVADDRPTGTNPRPTRRSAARRSAIARTTEAERIADDQLTIVPANEASWADLRVLFGSRSVPSRCWCQRFRMRPKEGWVSVGAEELARRFREQTCCDDPGSTTTSGLVAYLDGEPVGWCAVEPRPVYLRMLRNNRVPWDGRNEDKTDDSVWAVTCFVTRTGFGRRGVSRALARAAVGFARQRGARALEGYPDLVERGHVGSRRVFADAGLVEVSRPTNRRAVMRIDF